MKKCLHIINEQLYKLCFDFYDSRVNLQSDHDAFIAPIPKKANPECHSEFRPISLLSMPIKIITKLLTNRL